MFGQLAYILEIVLCCCISFCTDLINLNEKKTHTYNFNNKMIDTKHYTGSYFYNYNVERRKSMQLSFVVLYRRQLKHLFILMFA